MSPIADIPPQQPNPLSAGLQWTESVSPEQLAFQSGEETSYFGTFGNSGSLLRFTPFYPKSKDNRGMSGGTPREELDAKLEAVEARTDTKIARLEGKIDLVISKLDTVLKDSQQTRDAIRSESRSSREITWGVGIGAVAIIIGILALFPSMFGMGTQVRDMVHAEVQQAVTKAVPVAPTKP